jgi:hypothetical protein
MVAWQVTRVRRAGIEHPEEWISLRRSIRSVFPHHSDPGCAASPTADDRYVAGEPAEREERICRRALEYAVAVQVEQPDATL